MKKLSLNFKKIALSLLVVGLAMGVQSFTSAENADTLAPQWVYVQKSADVYVKIPYSSFVPGDCELDSERPCAFIQPETDTNDHTSPLSYSTISGISTLEPTANEGLYSTAP